MDPVPVAQKNYFRTLLVLGRASNLPTVWSNCLAAWLLGDGGTWSSFFLLCVAASCLYTGGMYLNDAFDTEFDRQHRKERPIPSGAITPAEVWGYGVGWLLLGLALFSMFGLETSILALFLLACVLVYDAVHKAVTFSPVVMAACRFFLFLAAASTSDDGVTGLAVWTAFALSFYIVGLSYVAKSESTRGPLKYWPCLLLAAPLLLAWLVNQGDFKIRGVMLSALLLIWIIRNLSYSFGPGQKNIGRTVSGLLAGIVLVDLLSVTHASAGMIVVFLGLFGVALLFQRFIPAT